MKYIAIGDIHGLYYELDILLEAIEGFMCEPYTVVFLGDYVDRGDESKQVLDRLMMGPTDSRATWVCLKGNHEELMLEAYREPFREGQDLYWRFRCGGASTVLSFSHHIDPVYFKWLEKLPWHYETKNHYFVHGGINPYRGLDQQQEEECLWIRDKFLRSTDNFEKYVVHGHTPTDDYGVEIKHNRCNLDSGCVFGGQLSAALFDEDCPLPEYLFQIENAESTVKIKKVAEELNDPKFTSPRWLDEGPY